MTQSFVDNVVTIVLAGFVGAVVMVPLEWLMRSVWRYMRRV